MSDEQLIERLRELSLVETESLLAGVVEAEREAALAALVADLEHALEAARRRASELRRRLERAPDPLAAVDAPPAVRSAGGGSDFIHAAREAVRERTDACRELARLDSAALLVLPLLIEAERLRAGGR